MKKKPNNKYFLVWNDFSTQKSRKFIIISDKHLINPIKPSKLFKEYKLNIFKLKMKTCDSQIIKTMYNL